MLMNVLEIMDVITCAIILMVHSIVTVIQVICWIQMEETAQVTFSLLYHLIPNLIPFLLHCKILAYQCIYPWEPLITMYTFTFVIDVFSNNQYLIQILMSVYKDYMNVVTTVLILLEAISVLAWTDIY